MKNTRLEFLKNRGMRLLLMVSLFLTYPYGVLGQGRPYPSSDYGIQNPISANTIQDFVQDILSIVIQVGTPVLVIMIVYSGFLFVTARGNDEKLTKAKDTFFWVIIGSAIVLGALVISQAIESTVSQL